MIHPYNFEIQKMMKSGHVPACAQRGAALICDPEQKKSGRDLVQFIAKSLGFLLQKI